MSEYTDLVSRQGIACAMIYGFVFEPPWGPEHSCPGCQPKPIDAKESAYWDRWHALGEQIRRMGEASSCPILRGETPPRSYTDEERAALGRPRQTMPKTPPQIVEAAPIVVPPIEPQKDEPKQRRAPTRRTAKVPSTPKGQGSLF